MKAHISKSKIKLSVSMIVKNEEKYLDGCLSALQPLLDSVPSELVIVDTGSDDNTVEIAKKYTDEVYHFDWVDDFSAARNFGLEKCTGEWFMFLDADEHFSDLSEMIEFFSNDKKSSKYALAYYIVRNYSTESLDDDYTDFFAARIIRRTSNLRFVGVVHEHFNLSSDSIYYFMTYANHYGYMNTSSSSKTARNLPLLKKELKENPNDIRTMSHLLDAYSNTDEEKVALVEKAKKLALADENGYSTTIYIKLITYYMSNSNYDASHKMTDLLIKKLKDKDALLLDAYALKATLYYDKEQYAEAELYQRKYLDYFKDFKNGLLDMSLMPFTVVLYSSETKRDSFKEKLAYSCAKQGRIDDAIAVYQDVDFASQSINEYKKTINMFFEFITYSKQFGKMADISDIINQTCAADRIEYLNLKLEQVYFDGDLKGKFYPNSGLFAEMIKISESENQKDDTEKLISSIGVLPRGVSAILYFAIKNDVDLTPAISNMVFEDIEHHSKLIAEHISDMQDILLNYKDDSFFTSSIKKLTFGASFFEMAIKTAKKCADYPRLAELKERFSAYSSLLVKTIYNPDLLNETDIGALPIMHRFGYFINENDTINASTLETTMFPPCKEKKADLIDEDIKELAYKYAKESNTDDAIALYLDTDFAGIDMDEFTEIVDMIFDFTNYSIQYDNFAKACDRINELCRDDNEKIGYLNIKLENKYYSGSLSRRFNPTLGNFKILLSFIGDGPTPMSLEEFIDSFNPLPPGFTEAFYLALKQNADLTSAVEKMEFELLTTHISTIKKYKKNFGMDVIYYMDDEFFFESVKNLNMGLVLFYEAIKDENGLSPTAKSAVYEKISLYSSLFASNAFNPVFNSIEDITSLPEVHRFGVFIKLANTEYENGNVNGYVEKMRAALRSCKTMTGAIGFLLSSNQ